MTQAIMDRFLEMLDDKVSSRTIFGLMKWKLCSKQVHTYNYWIRKGTMYKFSKIIILWWSPICDNLSVIKVRKNYSFALEIWAREKSSPVEHSHRIWNTFYWYWNNLIIFHCQDITHKISVLILSYLMVNARKMLQSGIMTFI